MSSPARKRQKTDTASATNNADEDAISSGLTPQGVTISPKSRQDSGANSDEKEEEQSDVIQPGVAPIQVAQTPSDSDSSSSDSPKECAKKRYRKRPLLDTEPSPTPVASWLLDLPEPGVSHEVQTPPESIASASPAQSASSVFGEPSNCSNVDCKSASPAFAHIGSLCIDCLQADLYHHQLNRDAANALVQGETCLGRPQCLEDASQIHAQCRSDGIVKCNHLCCLSRLVSLEEVRHANMTFYPPHSHLKAFRAPIKCARRHPGCDRLECQHWCCRIASNACAKRHSQCNRLTCEHSCCKIWAAYAGHFMDRRRAGDKQGRLSAEEQQRLGEEMMDIAKVIVHIGIGPHVGHANLGALWLQSFETLMDRLYQKSIPGSPTSLEDMNPSESDEWWSTMQDNSPRMRNKVASSEDSSSESSSED